MPILGPHVGAILAAFIYLLLIESHWSEEEVEITGRKYQVQDPDVHGTDNEGLGESKHVVAICRWLILFAFAARILHKQS